MKEVKLEKFKIVPPPQPKDIRAFENVMHVTHTCTHAHTHAHTHTHTRTHVHKANRATV
jgi:hypothetical protein